MKAPKIAVLASVSFAVQTANEAVAEIAAGPAPPGPRQRSDVTFAARPKSYN